VFLRILHKSFTRALKEKLLIMATIAFGASLASGMFNVALDVGDKMNREFKSYGANLAVTPKMDALPVDMDGLHLNPLGSKAYLQEDQLSGLKTIFWANNILGFTPYLETDGKMAGAKGMIPVVGTWFKKDMVLSDGNTFTTGVAEMKSWWNVIGAWPRETGDSQEVLVGKRVADRLHIQPGDSFDLQIHTAQGYRAHTLRASGVLDAGGNEDDTIYAPLVLVQSMLELPGKIGRAEVSALTVPDNELAERAGNDPSSLREKDFDDWYCTAFAGAIAYQIEESIPDALAKPIRQIADSEGAVLTKIRSMTIMISLAAVVSSALGITSLMNNKVQQRKQEIALMKALGGGDLAITAVFLGEALVSGLIGGCAGYGLGLLFAWFIGESVFGTEFEIKWLGLPLILLLSLVMTACGSFPAVRSIMRLDPIRALYGR